MSKKWHEFERLFQRIQQQLAPGAEVMHDQTIIGRSGAANKCDVVIRAQVGQFNFLVIVECQRRRKKVPVGFVREVASKRTDARADRAVIVNRAGFTRDALKLAIEEQIATYTLVDATAQDWRKLSAIPCVFGVLRPLKARLALFTEDRKNLVRCTDNDGAAMTATAYRLLHAPTQRELSLEALIEQVWSSIVPSLHDAKPGEMVTFTEPGQFSILDDLGAHPIVARLSYTLTAEFRYGCLPIIDGHRLVDLQNRSVLDETYSSGNVSFEEVWKDWPAQARREDVPIDAKINIVAIAGFGQGVDFEQFALEIAKDSRP